MSDKKVGYRIGYIGIIDVLGFGRLSTDENSFDRIYNLVKHILYTKRNFERNLEYVEFAIMSDTVVVMIEADEKTQDYTFFQSILSNIGLIRTFTLDCIGLYSRAAVTFGKYYFDNSTNTIFGPAITKAVKLAEHSDEYVGHSIDNRFISRPAAILIDEVYCEKSHNTYYNYLLNGCTIDYIQNNTRISRIGDSKYYLYNPYYEAFQDYLFTSRNETNYTTDVIFEHFCKRERERLNRQINQANKRNKEKYNIEEEMLSSFERNFKLNGPLY